MEVKNELKVYEIDGSDTAYQEAKPLVLKSHWNRKRDFVNICIGDTEYTVLADELERAIRNCTNAE